MTPNTSSPRNFTNGFIWNAVTLFLKPGFSPPESLFAASVAVVFSSTK
jgi:hypothetical protein